MRDGHITREEYNEYLRTGKTPWDKEKEGKEGAGPSKGSKYHAKKCEVDGISFDSSKEGRRYAELMALQKAGEIDGLERQVAYVLIPEQKGEGGEVLERAVSYRADFKYRDAATGEQVVEDVKGMRTKEYILKRKLMLWVHHIRIKEV